MSYSVYFKYGGRSYKLPVNPEEIKKDQKLNIEKYQVLGSGAVSVPTYADLWEALIVNFHIQRLITWNLGQVLIQIGIFRF